MSPIPNIPDTVARQIYAELCRTLLRMQAERQKAEDASRPAAMQRAGYWFRSVAPPEPAAPAEPAPEPSAPVAAAPDPASPPRLE